MRALLLKDWYVTRKSCRSFLLIAAVFFAVSIFADNAVFSVYPALLAAILPVTLLSLDERSGWQRFADVLPVSRRDTVAAKYVCGLICIVLFGGLNALVTALSMARAGTLTLQGYCAELFAPFFAAFAGAALMLPPMFKFGTEKGRICYYIIFVVIFASFPLVEMGRKTGGMLERPAGMAALLGASVLLFAASYFLSARFYESREF